MNVSWSFLLVHSLICGLQFEGIQKFDGHHGEIWALAVSHHGNFVVTGSRDKSIRIFEKLDEPVSIFV